MPHFLLMYDVVPDYLTRRMPIRAAHLGYAQSFVDRGELLLGGALANPVDGALLLFQSEAGAKSFAVADPYVVEGLVTSWRVREWTTVIGREVSR